MILCSCAARCMRLGMLERRLEPILFLMTFKRFDRGYVKSQFLFSVECAPGLEVEGS